MESFCWILLNLEFICIIVTVQSYLGNWGKRVNFGNGIAEIQQKYEREREKAGERKFWISAMASLKFLLPKPANRETNCGNAIAEIGRKKNLWQLWQCHCRKWEEKKNSGCQNHIWGIKKKSATSTIFLQYFHNKSQVINYY